MRTSWMLLVALGVAFAGDAPIAADQEPGPGQILGAQPLSATEPAVGFGKTAKSVSDALRAAMERAKHDGRAVQKPTVVCGMTLIPGDMSIDPGIGARAPAPRGDVWYTIRALPPPVCNPTSAEASKR